MTKKYTSKNRSSEVTEVNETFAKDSSSVSGGVRGGLDGREGLFVHHLPGGEKTSRIRKFSAQVKPTN